MTDGDWLISSRSVAQGSDDAVVERVLVLLDAGAAIGRRGSNRLSFKLALAAAAWAALFGCRENTFDIIIIAALSFMAFAAFALGSPVRWERLEELHDAVRARDCGCS